VEHQQSQITTPFAREAVAVAALNEHQDRRHESERLACYLRAARSDYEIDPLISAAMPVLRATCLLPGASTSVPACE